MDSEAWIVVLFTIAVTLPLTLLAARGRTAAERRVVVVMWLVLVTGVGWGTLIYAPPVRAREPVTDRPTELAHGGYVTSRACKACHPAEYATWHRSYHRTMTQQASTDTIIGPVDGVVVQSRGRPFTLERRGKQVWVEMDDPDALDDPNLLAQASETPRAWHEIVQTTGSHSEQFYWISSGDSRRLTLLPIMYRALDEQRWAALDGCCISEPNTIQESANGRWNRVCNRCHATHTLPGIDLEEGEMDTHVAELGIACEACHRPGEAHVARYRDPRARYARHLGSDEVKAGAGEPDPSVADAIVNPAKLSKERSSEVCGQCHGVHVFKDDADRAEWRTDGFRYRPGDVLADSLPLSESGEDRFWSDGMIRVSGREYNGLVKSPCFQKGEMTCLSCHSMHKARDDPRSLDAWSDDQLHAGMDGDRACTQCHAQYTAPEKIAAHTHHVAGSTGSACMNCHMSYTTYGLLKGIRSHQVSSPSVEASLATGRPNACNQCHLDRTLAWSAAHLERWYGIQPPDLDLDQRTYAAGVLWTLQGDAGQRVLMAWSMGWDAARKTSGSDWMTPYLTVLVQDPYRAVRYIAHRSLARQPEAAGLERSDPLAQPAEQFRRVQPILAAWGARPRPAAPSLLITQKGEVDLALLQRLMSRRNDRAVVLNE
jgi:hypothetical protein